MNCTDQKPAPSKGLNDESRALAAPVLAAVAEHFKVKHPALPLESYSLLVCASVEAYNIGNRSREGDVPAMSEAALAAAPEAPEGITRGRYAELLLETVAELTGGQA